jgi:hypothetical protein
MVKICQTGLLELNFEIIPKNAFSGFCQKFPQAMHEVEIFFGQFPNPWTLRVSGMVCYTSKCEKSQNHCTIVQTVCGWEGVGGGWGLLSCVRDQRPYSEFNTMYPTRFRTYKIALPAQTKT